MVEKQLVRMVLPLAELPAFFLLLQQGVWMQVEVGCSVMSLLIDQFGIDAQYIKERITTLFLDGKAVDVPETAYVGEGSTLALSSAMPGLVGATMRRGGHLAAMRGGITYHSHSEKRGTGRVRVKLFNMLMAELGEALLAHGVSLSNGILSTFLTVQEEAFWQDFSATLDGQPIDPPGLKAAVSRFDATGESVLQVEFKV